MLYAEPPQMPEGIYLSHLPLAVGSHFIFKTAHAWQAEFRGCLFRLVPASFPVVVSDWSVLWSSNFEAEVSLRSIFAFEKL
jgi:hypothetical protein